MFLLNILCGALLLSEAAQGLFLWDSDQLNPQKSNDVISFANDCAEGKIQDWREF